MSENEYGPYIIGADMGQEESKTSFVRLRPGEIFTLSTKNMNGQRPKPGERCLIHNAFECVEVLRTIDMMILHSWHTMSGWKLFAFKVKTWFRLGPKRYNEPIYYRVMCLGLEG